MTDTVQTLDDLHKTISASTTLAPTRRRDLCSAIRSVCRLLDKTASDLPADIRILFRLIKAINPVNAGISLKRFQNITSDLRKAIDYADNQIATSRPKRSEEWQQLFESLPGLKLQNGLSGFMTFCSVREISPLNVDDTTATTYLDYVTHETFRAHPKRVHRDVCRLWNEAQSIIRTWPKVILSIPDNRPSALTIPWDQFPDPYKKDVAKYLDWKSGKNLLMQHSPLKPNRPKSLAQLQKHIHGLSSSAVKQGAPITSFITLADLIKSETAKLALEGYLNRFDQKPTHYIQDLAKTLHRISSEWVNIPDKHRATLHNFVRKLKPNEYGQTDKNIKTPHQFDAKTNIQKLLTLPGLLVQEAKKHKTKPAKAALLIQTAVAIEILLMAPMRASNLAALTLDKSMCNPDDKKGGITLVFGVEDKKNNAPKEYPLPVPSVKVIDLYIGHYRPHLNGDADNPWLFPGQTTSHKSTSHLCVQIKKTIFKYTGITITVGQFRHITAKLFLDENPGSY